MKTALELLGDDECKEHDARCLCELELVARRAREEAYEMAANIVKSNHEVGLCCAESERRIRALPTEPQP